MLRQEDVEIIGQRLKKYGFETMAEYRATERWRKVKAKYYSSHEYRCIGCDARHDLQLHHKTYKRLCREWMRDLAYVCDPCHERIHQLSFERNWSIAKATRKVRHFPWVW